MNRENRILSFIENIKNDKDFIFGASVRLSSSHPMIRSGKAKQIRSNRHAFDAVAFDQLGNATALKRDGGIVQLITKKEQKEAGIR